MHNRIDKEQPLLVLIGPTAVGKTDLSLKLAQQHNCEIISVDSMQVYRYMDIGTAKASDEERKLVPHHLIDIVDPDVNYDAAMYMKDSLKAVSKIQGKKKIPLLTGGTGMYLQATMLGIFEDIGSDSALRAKLQERLALEGISKLHEELRLCDEVTAERVQPQDTHRILRGLEIFLSTGKPWSAHLATHKEAIRKNRFNNVCMIGLTCDREVLYSRINLRCEQMLRCGLRQEVENLLSKGYSSDLKAMGSIGYRHMVKLIKGEYNEEEMIRVFSRDTRRYAKRQYTWFNKIEEIEWYDANKPREIMTRVSEWLAR